MKKLVVIGLIAGLVLGSFGVADARKKRRRRSAAPVHVDQKLFLRRDDCGGDADNTRLSIEDGEDVACSWDDSGVAWEVYRETGLAEPAQVYPAENGLPLTLDTSKPITGEITLYHAPTCVEDPVCTPQAINVGAATFTLAFVATIAGEDKEIGVVEEDFNTTPGSTHTIAIDLEMDAALNGAIVEALRIEAFHGGQALGPGGIEYDDPASFITVPVLVAR